MSPTTWDHIGLPPTRRPAQVNTPGLNRNQTGWYSITYPGGMEGWVDLSELLHTEMVYPPNPSAKPAGSRTRNLLITSPTPEPVPNHLWTLFSSSPKLKTSDFPLTKYVRLSQSIDPKGLGWLFTEYGEPKRNNSGKMQDRTCRTTNLWRSELEKGGLENRGP